MAERTVLLDATEAVIGAHQELIANGTVEVLRETTQDLPNTATDFDIGSGASIIFTSLAGRVLASADESSTTPLCD